MDESTNVLAWPTCPGYMTVKPLSTKSPCKVWLIRRESDQQYMVLKLSLTMENVASQRLHNVNAARKYVVDSYGMLSTQLGDGLLMEYCPGGSLAALMARRSNFTLAECVTALAPIAQAIAGLHAAGMRHGDISPSNIMLTAQGMPKIIDFQEASLSQDAAEVAGTPGFIAPETFTGAGEEELGARDVFALGSCLWYLLDGEPPDEPHYRPPVRVQFPGVPEIIQELLADSLDEDPLQRPTADQFARTLFSSIPAAPIHWEGFIDTDSNQLMDTIHPDVAARTQHRRAGSRRKAGKTSTVIPGDSGSWHGHRLRRTPGGAKVVAALAIGGIAIAASFLGVKYLLPGQPPDPAAQGAVPGETPGCRILDVGEVPACSFEADTVIASFLALSAARDRAMNSGDSSALRKIYVEDSEQLQRDRETLDSMRKLKLRFNGLETKLEDVSIQARGSADTVILQALSTHSSYTYVDAAGTLRHQVAAGDPERIQVEVELVDGQWFLGTVLSRSD